MPLKNRFFFFALLATTCASFAFGRADTVPASVSGVNYTDQDIRYMLFDPNDEKQKVVAAEDIGPFAAGGVICCYDLPKVWKPGIKVGVLLDVFDEKLDDYLPRQTFTVELPPYDKNGKAGDVWFIRYPDGKVGVVSTSYRPNGDEWPGRIKGWPRPSVEYQRKVWAREVGRLEKDIAADEKPWAMASDDLRGYWKAWGTTAMQKEMMEFTGPEDPAFLDYVDTVRRRALGIQKRNLEYLLGHKP